MLPTPRLFAQIHKEFLCILRDPKSRFILIVPPVLQLLLFAFAATLELKNVDIAVSNRDAGRWGYELVSRLGSAGFVRHLHPAQGYAEMGAMIDRQQVIAALDIPDSFSRDVEAHRPAKVQVVLDGRRGNSTQILLGYLNSILGNLNAELSATANASGGTIAVRHWFNPNLIDQWFIVPSLGGNLVMMVTLLVTALSIARERELGTFDQLLVSPCTPAEIIVAKIVPAVCLGMVLGTFMAVVGILAFRIPFTGSFLWLLGSMLLFITSIAGIGLMISSVCNTQQQAILGTFAISVPAILVSGFATPVENMPTVLQWLAQGIPLKHYLILVRGCFLKDMPTAELMANTWPMAVIAAVTLTAATLFVRSKLE